MSSRLFHRYPLSACHLPPIGIRHRSASTTPLLSLVVPGVPLGIGERHVVAPPAAAAQAAGAGRRLRPTGLPGFATVTAALALFVSEIARRMGDSRSTVATLLPGVPAHPEWPALSD